MRSDDGLKHIAATGNVLGGLQFDGQGALCGHVEVGEWHAARRVAGGSSGRLGPETMRYMLDFWLRRTLTRRIGGPPPPLMLLAYLWDKQPAAAFKAGNRALCRRMRS